MNMQRFGLARPPFAATPQVGCCFAHEAWHQLHAELSLRLRAGQGICVLTGAAGLGKTLSLKLVAHELHRDFCIVSLPTPGVLDLCGFQHSLLAELEVGRLEGTAAELRLAIHQELRGLIRNGRPAVILVDEAHALASPLLEELRTLAAQDEEGEPLARILLAGQPLLEETLASPGYDALNQQIVCQKLLEPLGLTDSVEYILHRVAWAGGDPETLFSIEALDAVVRAAGGNPRLLNRACDLALLLSAAREQDRVDAEAMHLALEELQKLPLAWQPLSPGPRSRSASLTDGNFPSSEPAPTDSERDSSAWTAETGTGDPGAAVASSPAWSEDSARFGYSPREVEERETEERETEEASETELDVHALPGGITNPAADELADNLRVPGQSSVHSQAQSGGETGHGHAWSLGSRSAVAAPQVPETGHSQETAWPTTAAATGPWAAWPPYVPAESIGALPSDSAGGFETLPTHWQDADSAGEWQWLLPRSNSPRLAPPIQPQWPTGAASGLRRETGLPTTGASSAGLPGRDPCSPQVAVSPGCSRPGPHTGLAGTSANPVQKFETHVEPPVGVERIPLGPDSASPLARVSVSPAHRASEDAPRLERRDYGLRGAPPSTECLGEDPQEFDVVEPEPVSMPQSAGQWGASDPNSLTREADSGLLSQSRGWERAMAPRDVAAVGSLNQKAGGPEAIDADTARPEPTHSHRQRDTAASRCDDEHATPPAPRTAGLDLDSTRAVRPTRGLGRLFSALRNRAESSPR